MKNSEQGGRHRGQQHKRADKMPRKHNVGVRLTDEEFKLLGDQALADGRDKSEILRDWFTQAPAPKPLPQGRRMGPFELANYHRLLALASDIW